MLVDHKGESNPFFGRKHTEETKRKHVKIVERIIVKLVLGNISKQYKRDINDFKWICYRCNRLDENPVPVRVMLKC